MECRSATRLIETDDLSTNVFKPFDYDMAVIFRFRTG